MVFFPFTQSHTDKADRNIGQKPKFFFQSSTTVTVQKPQGGGQAGGVA